MQYDGSAVVRFGEFEFDPRLARLERLGEPVRLSNQSLRLLALLLERKGEVAGRDELHDLLWPDTGSVDFEHNLNVAVSKLREALGDSPGAPRFIATVPRQGYKFIGSIEEPPSEAPAAGTRIRWYWAAAGGLLLAALVGSALLARHPRPAPHAMLLVLPFENLSGDPGQDYFSDGLTEETITQLGSLDPGRLGVIARTTSMRYKGTRLAVDRIAAELGVQYVVEGSVRREKDRVRVTAQLIRAADQTYIWAQSFDREAGALLSLENDSAAAISGAIGLALAVGKSAVHGSTIDSRAHEEYLRGRYYWNKRTGEGYRLAMEHFQRALDIDPAYARAYAGQADCYLLLADAGAPEVVLPKARAAARKALEIDEGLAEAHTSLGLVAMNFEWNWAESERQYRRAIELDPNYATAHHWYAEYLNHVGRFDEALREIGRAEKLDPLSPMIAVDHGKILHYARRQKEAIAQLKTVLAANPGFPDAEYWLARACAEQGCYAEALAALDLFGDQARSQWLLVLRGHILARSGRRAEAAAIATQLENRGDPALEIYTILGQKDKAFRTLEFDASRHAVTLTSVKVAPVYDPLRGDPRFARLLQHVGLAR